MFTRALMAGTIAAGGAVAGGDPMWADVKLALRCQGTDGATTFTDAAGRHTVTANGGAQIDTAQTFGGRGVSSGLLDGAGDYLTIPDSPDFTLGSSFSAEAFVRFAALPGSGSRMHLFGHAGYLIDQFGWCLRMYNNGGTMQLEFGYSTTGLDAGATFVPRDWAASTGVDYYVAAVISGTTLKLFAGAASGSTVPQLGSDGTLSGSIANVSTTFDIGRRAGDSGDAQALNGHFIGPRLTAGLRSTGSTIDVPPGLFPASV